MLKGRLGFAVLLTLGLPLFCLADQTITFLDTADTVTLLVNGTGPFSCRSTTPEFCTNTDAFPAGTLSSLPAFSFNIYDPDGVTLSDTLQITTFLSPEGAPNIRSTFQSDIEGVPLTPLPGGTKIIENGLVQTAATIPLGGSFTGTNYIVQFQSDVEPTVPEPSSMGLLSLGLLGFAVVAKVHRRV